MIKKHLLFLLFHLKSNLRILPRILIAAVIFSIIVVAAGFGGSKLLNSKKNSIMHFNIAMVVESDDSKIERGMQIVTNTDSLKDYCSFTYTDMDSAIDMLSHGNVAAVVVLPDGFVDSIQNGTNIPARLILPAYAGYETLLFCSVIDAGSHTLSYVQSGIYAVDDYLIAHNMDDKVSEAEDSLNATYIKMALNRTSLFKKNVVTATGSLSTKDFYITSGIILILMLCGISITSCFSVSYKQTKVSLMLNRISYPYKRFCELISVSLIFYLILILVTAILPSIELSLSSALAMFLIVVSIMSFVMCVSVVTENAGVSAVVILLFTIISMYAGGRILPEAYISRGLLRFGKYLCTYSFSELLENALYSQIKFEFVLPVLIHTGIFIIITSVFTAVKERRRQ